LGCKQICKDYEDTIRPIRYDIGSKRCDSCRTVIVHTYPKKDCPCCHKLLKTRPKNFSLRQDIKSNLKQNRKDFVEEKAQKLKKEKPDLYERIRFMSKQLEDTRLGKKQRSQMKKKFKKT
jgi:hypothetical protein